MYVSSYQDEYILAMPSNLEIQSYLIFYTFILFWVIELRWNG